MGRGYEINDGGLHNINKVDISGLYIGHVLHSGEDRNFRYMQIDIAVRDDNKVGDMFNMYVTIEDEESAKMAKKLLCNASEIEVRGSLLLRYVYRFDIGEGVFKMSKETCIVADYISVLLTKEQREENMRHKKIK